MAAPVQRHGGHRAPGRRVAGDPVAAGEDHARILVVDDDLAILEATAELLEQEGYAVDTAQNGKVALDRIAAHPPDVILLDLMMPVMDGWAFCARLRETKAAHTPILVLSAVRNLGQTATELCADDYIGKPFDIDQLLGKIRHLIDRH